ncbi:unnamed protein product [Notodromas monacha]|uniref:G-protein coupled receptors family 3 profile domain-containing protein n=1 Tax=Notodromas monacha TaxID=399045 RepID=A0A7R9BKR1_9CRUS|nr:unnamed protein product [Notodromas monacha]CAG0916449.1 unnamed protein product [Notodromas monacha]
MVSQEGFQFPHLLCASLLLLGKAGAALKPLHIGGIFPINGTSAGWQGGQACQPAAMLALEDVNKREDILPGYELSLTWNDSECNPGLGASVMYDLLYKPPQKVLLLGGCSTVCTTIAEAAKMWNLVVLSYGASSPALSDRNRFPTFFRTHPSATVQNPTRVKLFQKFGWTRIAILQQAEEVFISTVEDLVAKCSEAGIEVVTRQSFLTDPTDAIKNLVRQDARIIVGLFYVVAARRVLCEIFTQKLYGESFAWFLIGWYEDNWYQINLKEEHLACNQEQMKLAAEGHITTEALMWNRDNAKTISGMTSDEFKARLDKALVKVGYDVESGRYPEGYQEAPLAYDAIWAAALALNKTMRQLRQMKRSLEEFTYEDKEIAHLIYSSMNTTQFLGISGTVAFSAKGDRIAWTQIEQMVNGSYVPLGYFDTHTNNLTWLKSEKWIGGKPPKDKTEIKDQLRTVSLTLLAAVSSISLVGILAALGLLCFMYAYRTKRLIRQSQPICNCMTLVGVCVSLTGASLLGLDGRLVPSNLLAFICHLRAWLLTIGFSLSYGAMFAKIWSVHSLATKAKAQGTKPPSGPHRPWLMVVGFVVVDIIILSAWTSVDPLERKLELFPLEDPPPHVSEDIKILPQLEHCVSRNNPIWLGIQLAHWHEQEHVLKRATTFLFLSICYQAISRVIYAYKGLLLLFGLFLSYETRSVKLKMVNDSRYVGMAIYNVAILCVITAPVSLVIASQPDASFAFIAFSVIFCCLISLGEYKYGFHSFLSGYIIASPEKLFINESSSPPPFQTLFIAELISNPSNSREEIRHSNNTTNAGEDYQKLQRLLKENEELQRSLDEVSWVLQRGKLSGVIYAYKGLLLLFGLFLSYETRSVKLKMVNDSRYVGMAIYNVAILCVITAPVSLVIASQPDASFAFIAFSVIFCCLISLALIFIPKFLSGYIIASPEKLFINESSPPPFQTIFIAELISNPSNSREEIRHSNNSTNAGEDYQKLQRLLKENEELQRSLDEKDARIRLLKVKIEEKKQRELAELSSAAAENANAAAPMVGNHRVSSAATAAAAAAVVAERRQSSLSTSSSKPRHAARIVPGGRSDDDEDDDDDDESELRPLREAATAAGEANNESDLELDDSTRRVRIAADGASESNDGRGLLEDQYFLKLADGVEVELVKPSKGAAVESYL